MLFFTWIFKLAFSMVLYYFFTILSLPELLWWPIRHWRLRREPLGAKRARTAARWARTPPSWRSRAILRYPRLLDSRKIAPVLSWHLPSTWLWCLPATRNYFLVNKRSERVTQEILSLRISKTLQIWPAGGVALAALWVAPFLFFITDDVFLPAS